MLSAGVETLQANFIAVFFSTLRLSVVQSNEHQSTVGMTVPPGPNYVSPMSPISIELTEPTYTKQREGLIKEY